MMRTALFVVLAAVTGFVAARQVRETASAPTAKETGGASPAAPTFSVAARTIDGVERVETQPHAGIGSRNLFAYREQPATLPARVVAPPLERRAPSPAVVVAQNPAGEAPAAPTFAWRYIGTFGNDETTLAAFTRDGEVVNARIGDRVGEFVLRSIGIESVEVQPVTGEATQRIALASTR